MRSRRRFAVAPVVAGAAHAGVPGLTRGGQIRRGQRGGHDLGRIRVLSQCIR